MAAIPNAVIFAEFLDLFKRLFEPLFGVNNMYHFSVFLFAEQYPLGRFRLLKANGHPFAARHTCVQRRSEMVVAPGAKVDSKPALDQCKAWSGSLCSRTTKGKAVSNTVISSLLGAP